MWVYQRPLLKSLLDSVNGQGADSFAILDNGWLGLLKDPYSPGVDSKITDATFHEANYNGYARVQLTTFTDAHVGQNGLTLTDGVSKLWKPTGSDTVNTIYGHFLTGSDSTTLLAVEMFDAPIPLPTADDAFEDLPIFGLPVGAIFGSSLISE